MSQYMDEIAPDVISPHDNKLRVDQPIKHLDTVIALYEFPGTQPSHLPLNLGDTIYVLSKSDSGWWDGVVITNTGELQRGWFPHNYVRSVNYVQPVLNKLKSNKELDSITAANTAANVLIPTFANLLQKNLIESEKNTPSNSTRKNSVVSFASSETSIPSDSKNLTSISPQQQQMQTSQSQQSQSHQPSLSTISSGSHQNPSVSHTLTPGDLNDNVIFADVEEVERLVKKYKQDKKKLLMWIPKCTTNGDFVFYCEQLDIYCESMPMVDFSLGDIPPNMAIPSTEALNNNSVVPVETNRHNSDGGVSDILDARADSAASFDPLKRDSSASSISQSSGSSYHHFTKPFFAVDRLFYKHPQDLTKWSDLKKQFNYLLDLSAKSLKDHNKQLFSTHFSRLNKIISIVFAASRLNQEDFIDTKYETSVRRKLKRIASSFAQIYINGILHLSVMHHSQATSEGQLFSFDIFKLNKSTSTKPGNSYQSNISSISTVRQSSQDTLNSISPGISFDNTNQGPGEFVSYFQHIEFEIENLRLNMNVLIKIMTKLSKDKVIRRSDYDSSDASEDEGEDRFDILPQTYPRFITDEFNGGNWCNPFFTTSNPILNVSGDDLKNRYHSKIIIDHQAYDSLYHFSEEMTKLSNETCDYLNPDSQSLYYNTSLKNDRNTHILRLIYKYLYYASSTIDLIESFDFTVFCLIKRYSSNEENDVDKINDQLLKGDNKDKSQDSSTDPKSEDPKATTTVETTSNLTFDYPVVLEFFQLKQEFHNLILKIIMATQTLTLDDPEVFKGLRDEDPLFYDRDILKLPTEKASLLLTNILTEQINQSKGDAISVNPDTLMLSYLLDGTKFFETLLNLVQQLIDERETILNYATRVMHDDFNVQLLVIERNNTILSDKSDDHSYYSGGHKKAKDLPWYLEGDEENDLLLDLKGNIKGGTKEALVSHLTHHDLFDSNFNSAFLFTFATMMSLGELIGLLISRFNIEAPEGLSYEEYNTWITKKQNPIRIRVMNIMTLLIEKHWSKSYYNETILRKWLLFSQLPIVQSYSIGKQLNNDLVRLLKGEMVYIDRKPVIPTTKPPAPLIKGSLISKKMKLMDIDYVELARQLTIREFNLYAKISKFACLAKVWGNKSGLNETIENIQSFIQASNQLTNYVAYMILRKTDAKKRVQIIRYFVQVAEKCRQYNNFSSMTAIISALYSSPIHRLKKTWKYVHTDSLSHLQNMNKLMNTSRNFNEYRDVLKFSGSEPCVPFFGVFLSDLTFVYHGNPDNLLNRTRMINFAKRAKTFEIVSGIDRFKATGYNFQSVVEIQKYLDSWFDKCPSVEEQYQISLELEPREPTTSTNNTTSSSSSKLHSTSTHSTVATSDRDLRNSKGSGPTTNLSSFAFKGL
ncbi:cell division control protein 25 [Scheffersomyces coipomensis]|uniref:cell division control protein 25 n=1 Tax=Scheffersomyces coipomensis TaxID=1788519 RepID=UPI00315C9BE7